MESRRRLVVPVDRGCLGMFGGADRDSLAGVLAIGRRRVAVPAVVEVSVAVH